MILKGNMIVSHHKSQNSAVWINPIKYHFFNRSITNFKCLYELGTFILKLTQLTVIFLQFLGKWTWIKLPTWLIIRLSGPSSRILSPNSHLPFQTPFFLVLMLMDIQILLCPPDPTLPSLVFTANSLLPLLMTWTSLVESWLPPGLPKSRPANTTAKENAFITRMEMVYCTSIQDELAFSQ